MIADKFGLRHVSIPSVYWQSFKLLYLDLEESFRYVHPCEAHLKTHSLRLYELFLRACTEFESICKDTLLTSNLTPKEAKDFNIADYHLLNAHFEGKPSNIQVGYIFESPLFVRPLAEWTNGPTLTWYKEYNQVKHNRASSFHLANLINVLNAVGALFIMIERRRFCPPSQIGSLGSDTVPGLIRTNEEWPVVLVKDYK